MTIEETIRALEAEGWRLVFHEDNLRQYKHDSKAGIVTLSGKTELDIPTGVLRSLWRYIRFQEEEA